MTEWECDKHGTRYMAGSSCYGKHTVPNFVRELRPVGEGTATPPDRPCKYCGEQVFSEHPGAVCEKCIINRPEATPSAPGETANRALCGVCGVISSPDYCNHRPLSWAEDDGNRISLTIGDVWVGHIAKWSKSATAEIINDRLFEALRAYAASESRSLRQQLDAARVAALEEAAKIADKTFNLGDRMSIHPGYKVFPNADAYRAEAAKLISRQIRALEEQK